MKKSRHGASARARRSSKPRLALLAAAIASLCGCASGDGDAGPASPTATALSCDEALKAAFRPDADTEVLFVHPFRAGQPLSLAAAPPAGTPTASADVCLVKLRVGPGHPGPAGAPSTTAGIGLEVWLPAGATWDGRIRAEAPGAFMGDGRITSTTDIGSAGLATFAADHGTVTVVTDGGHADGFSGMFLTLPDGTPNTFGWKEISYRAVHEMSVKTKALAQAFYAKPPSRAYAYGCSSGGRAVYQSAQMHPEDFDGIVADAVSLNQTQYFPALMYPQLVMQRDLADQGLPLLSKAKRDAVSAAALQACDTAVNGSHDGYLTHPEQCRYDPTQDAAVLCTGDGGTNTTDACVTRREAQVMNKIWYGVTVDGSVPDPAVDNGTSPLRPPNQLWWGRKRGTGLDFTMASVGNQPALGILGIVVDQIAWNLQDLRLTRSDYVNAAGTGQNRWMQMSYGEFAQAFYQGRLLNETVFANIDANNPDLGPFRDRGAKMISMVGVSDPFVSVEAMLDYYARSSALAGGHAQAQAFHRLFLVPGRGHCGGTGSVGSDGGNPPQVSADQMYFKVVDWVEKQQAPASIVATSPDGTRSRPLCMYPTKVKYLGGDVDAATSYTCE